MHYDVDEATGEIKYIGKEEITVNTADTPKKTTKSSSVLTGDTPCLKLSGNNYAINELAQKLLGVEVGGTLFINYPKKDGQYVPAIGTSEAFGVKSGNKVTKSLTVSFRGAANTRLAEFGDTFEFIESGKPGIFYLKGNKVAEVAQEGTIEIDESFELEDLEDIDLDVDESLDISTIDLTL